MITLNSVGELIDKRVKAVVTTIEKKLLNRTEPQQLQTKSAMILSLLMIVLMLITCPLMMNVFNWTLVEAVYFWFISFTTVGFGDYIPSHSQRIQQLSLYSPQNHGKEVDEATYEKKITYLIIKRLLIFYRIFVLCIVSSVLNSIVAAVQERKCRPRCPGCVPRKTQDHSDSEETNTSEHAQHHADMTYVNMENFGFSKDNLNLNNTEQN